MKKYVLFALVLVITILSFYTPQTAHAWKPGDPIIPCGDSTSNPATGTGTSEQQAQKQANDCNLQHFYKLIDNVIDIVFYVAVISLACLFVYHGARIMTAGGDTGRIAQARKQLTTVVVGIVLILSSWLIIQTVTNLFLNTQNGYENPLR